MPNTLVNNLANNLVKNLATNPDELEINTPQIWSKTRDELEMSSGYIYLRKHHDMMWSLNHGAAWHVVLIVF